MDSQDFDENMDFLNQPDMMNLDDFNYYPGDSARTPEDHDKPPDRSRRLFLLLLYLMLIFHRNRRYG